jgi:hypothetical protein
MRSAGYKLFGDRTSNELVLLYFSRHGVTDEYGKFFFTNCETQTGNLHSLPGGGDSNGGGRFRWRWSGFGERTAQLCQSKGRKSG